MGREGGLQLPAAKKRLGLVPSLGGGSAFEGPRPGANTAAWLRGEDGTRFQALPARTTSEGWPKGGAHGIRPKLLDFQMTKIPLVRLSSVEIIYAQFFGFILQVSLDVPIN